MVDGSVSRDADGRSGGDRGSLCNGIGLGGVASEVGAVDIRDLEGKDEVEEGMHEIPQS